MGKLPPLTSRIDRGAESGGEFERLLNQLLLCYADRHNFAYEPVGGAGGDSGIDGLVRRGGVPGFQGPVAFQFKWLWDGIHKSSKARQIAESLTRASQAGEINHWVLVTPHELTPAENDWLLARSPRPDLAVHHWGQTRLEGLLRDYCPALFARYYVGGQQDSAGLVGMVVGNDRGLMAGKLGRAVPARTEWVACCGRGIKVERKKQR